MRVGDLKNILPQVGSRMSEPRTDATHVNMQQLTVALVGPQEARRQKIRSALANQHVEIQTELRNYPEPRDIISETAGCEVVIVDLAADPGQAVDLIETICASDPSITVMAYSLSADPELLMNCMRAGAREFLIEPVQTSALTDALVRAFARRPDLTIKKKVRGRILAFTGAKGGSGVTTIASNFALCLAKESGAKVVLVDLDVRMGDAALILGMNCRFSVVDALLHAERLDKDFLATLLSKHGSGLQVLAGPEEYTPVSSMESGAPRLFRLLKEEFDYIVVDAGANVGKMHEALLDVADSVYLVTEVSIPALRAANRLITWFSERERPQTVEVVVNRHDSRTIEIDENRIAKALTTPANWNIPNHFNSVREAQNTGVPLASNPAGPITKVLTRMARAVCGKPQTTEVKKKFGLFR